jgi:hypothetical protein
MNDATGHPTTTSASTSSDYRRALPLKIAGWTAGVSALAAAIALLNAPTWPVAFGVAAVAAMVTIVCRGILKG